MSLQITFDSAPTTGSSTLSGTTPAATGFSFQQALAAAQEKNSGASDTETAQKTGAAGKSKQQTAEEKAAATKAAHRALAQELQDYLRKTPAEHLREQVLKEMGLTEEELAKMPPDKRQATEMAIAERIRKKLEAKAEEQSLKASGAQAEAASSAVVAGAGGAEKKAGQVATNGKEIRIGES